MSIIEHTLNVLVLPGLHTDSRSSESALGSTLSLVNSSTPGGVGHSNTAGQPSLAIPGLRGWSVPSPLHLRLRVLTRLSFNEQGRITRHRDFWDVRDVLGLVPGMRVAQWVGTRVAAQGISVVTRAASWAFGRYKGRSEGSESSDTVLDTDREGGMDVESPAVTTVAPASGSSSRGEIVLSMGGSEHGTGNVSGVGGVGNGIGTNVNVNGSNNQHHSNNALGLQLHDGLMIPSGSWRGRSGGGVRLWGTGNSNSSNNVYHATTLTSIASEAPEGDT